MRESSENVDRIKGMSARVSGLIWCSSLGTLLAGHRPSFYHILALRVSNVATATKYTSSSTGAMGRVAGVGSLGGRGQ